MIVNHIKNQNQLKIIKEIINITKAIKNINEIDLKTGTKIRNKNSNLLT